MSDNLNKFKAILREMFQFDQADLDFGIYRIMNSKRDEIERFLDRDLLPQVKTAFEAFQGDDQSSVREEMEKLRKTLVEAGVDPETSTKYQDLRQKLSGAVDVQALESEVFSQLTNFFRRYYQEGDFLSLRRYKAGVYAIPYEGEEVKLHWANADQYYIKSSEDFRDYSFTPGDGKKVHFKLVEASTEQNNKKEQNGKERRFILCDEKPVVEQDGDLYIRFEYRMAEGKTKQAALNDAAVQTIRASLEGDWLGGLTKLAPTAKNPKRTLLEKHLGDYTAKYSFDYFIHKDLGGFLRRELDFFIKNEVLFIDDLDADHIKASISKAKVLKQIGHKVIAFLEQLENFQKKLWLKKKFVVETGYCVTLDRVPEELYPDIIANAAQLEEWKRLFSIQEIKGDLHSPQFTIPLTTDFLKTNRFLVLDTNLFDQEFTEKLLTSFDHLDEATNGLLVNGENSQVLNLIRECYRGQVKCIYADPPYNTGGDGFCYKDGYQHSSWLSMMSQVNNASLQLMSSASLLYLHIDDNEVDRLKSLMTNIYGEKNFQSLIAWKNKYGPGAMTKGFGSLHEYVLVYSSGQLESIEAELSEEEQAKYTNRDEKYNVRGGYITQPLATKSKDDRPNLVYPISHEGEEIWPDKQWIWAKDRLEKALANNEVVIRKKNGKFSVRFKQYLRDENGKMRKAKPLSLLLGPFNQDGTFAIEQLFGERVFGFPKPNQLAEKLLNVTVDGVDLDKAIFLDYFAGSGTTGQAILNLNRNDGGSRRYILIEMGDYADSVIQPRLQKATYSKDWQEGKPVSREGSSHMFKYIRLESYEDALNNLQLKRTEDQQSLLDQNDPLREQYMLSYMLDVETAGSASLLNIDAFTDPFNYRMNIARGNETKETVVDLVETFNWLLGIKVLRIGAREYRMAEFEHDAEGRLQIKDRPRTCAAGEGWTFKEVEGETLDGDKVLIIWRTLTGNPEQDNLMLDAWFSKRNYSTLDFEFSRIYVNGDNNLENLKIGEERWKVALIEEEFKRLMFSMEEA